MMQASHRQFVAFSRFAIARRGIHATRPCLIKVGDRVPDVKLMEGSPGNQVSIAQELSRVDRGLIIGVPAAYSPGCSESHIPGYLNHKGLAAAGPTFVVAVNDAFVMGAWGKILDPSNKSGVRFLADPSAEFTKQAQLDFDGSAIFGGARSKRYALVIQNGKVKSMHVEPDNTGIKESTASKVLG